MEISVFEVTPKDGAGAGKGASRGPVRDDRAGTFSTAMDEARQSASKNEQAPFGKAQGMKAAGADAGEQRTDKVEGEQSVEAAEADEGEDARKADLVEELLFGDAGEVEVVRGEQAEQETNEPAVFIAAGADGAENMDHVPGDGGIDALGAVVEKTDAPEKASEEQGEIFEDTLESGDEVNSPGAGEAQQPSEETGEWAAAAGPAPEVLDREVPGKGLSMAGPQSGDTGAKGVAGPERDTPGKATSLEARERAGNGNPTHGPQATGGGPDTDASGENPLDGSGGERAEGENIGRALGRGDDQAAREENAMDPEAAEAADAAEAAESVEAAKPEPGLKKTSPGERPQTATTAESAAAAGNQGSTGGGDAAEGDGDGLLRRQDHAAAGSADSTSEKPSGETFQVASHRGPRTDAEVYEKFLNGMRMSFSQGGKAVKIRLHPDNLGHMEIKLDIDDNKAVTARIVVENAHVKGILESDSSRLKELLASQGLKLDSYSVDVSPRDPGTSGESGGSALNDMFGDRSPAGDGNTGNRHGGTPHSETLAVMTEGAYGVLSGDGRVDVFA